MDLTVEKRLVLAVSRFVTGRQSQDNRRKRSVALKDSLNR